MEKKVHLWASLILGVPILRLIEVYTVTYATGGLRGQGIFGHIGLGLVIGIGCVMASQLLHVTDKRVLWVMPLASLIYASILLFPTYPLHLFHQDPTYVSSLVLMDLGSWSIAVFGASLVGYVASREPVPAPAHVRTPIQNL